jgi:formylmethanofuran dehydrogenase subunit E
MEEGICEECGEYSQETAMVNGRWVCESCREYAEQ